ncbi:hypothetical protein V8E51_017252 [Hyaloscypha variabilis]
MSGDALEVFCLKASYIATFDILNIPSVGDRDSSREILSSLSWLAISNITTYISSPASILLNNFKYEAITSLPLAKSLAIQCPVSACIFPISGYFTFLQRILLYINIVIASFALHVPLLRGVAQIWLTTFWFSVIVMFLATMITTKVPMIYNLDFQPAVLIVHVGILPTLLWFSFRAEPGEARHAARQGENADHADVAHDADDIEASRRSGILATCKIWFQKLKKAFLEFPVTRFLVPAYAIFGLMNIILANEVQNSGGFWPEATAVILSNGTDYLLTSPCYADQSGFVGLWPPAPSPYNGIRNLTSLSIYYSPPGSTAADALQATSRVALTTMHVGSVLLCFVIFILSFYTLHGMETWLSGRFRMPHKNKRTIRFIVIFPFIFPLVLAVLLTLYTVVKFEINAWHAALPENEAYTEIGQWSPYVVAFIVFIATLTARIKGWDFDSKDTDSEKRVFGWLLTERRFLLDHEERWSTSLSC